MFFCLKKNWTIDSPWSRYRNRATISTLRPATCAASSGTIMAAPAAITNQTTQSGIFQQARSPKSGNAGSRPWDRSLRPSTLSQTKNVTPVTSRASP